MLWHADADYLRLTYKKGHAFQAAYDAYVRAADKVAADLILPGYTWQDWHWQGYRGRYLGPVAVGESEQGAIIQVSGAAAAAAVRLRLPYTGCPRLDLQVTYWLGADFKSLAWEVAQQTDKARFKGSRTMWKARLVDGRGDGDTCYIGRRGNRSKFLRCYDKWRQQGKSNEYKYAWRFEAELTDEHAEYAMGTLLDTDLSEYTVLAVLASYWTERGVQLPEVQGGGYFAPSRIKRPPEDVGRTVKWLEEQVRPALDKAMGRGLTEDQIRSILGL